MADNLDVVWNKFFEHRTRPLWDRYPGMYRAEVVDTNDPLRAHRVRFKCPELHDWDLKPEECPWAVPATDLGSKRCGRFVAPCRGDWVWIAFEKGYPTAPVWTGFATPTRRKMYALPGVYGPTPVPVNAEGRPQSPPKDYNKEYLPRDGRPMSHGWLDRYGHLDLVSAVGYYPVEHAQVPPSPGYDGVQRGQFQSRAEPPLANQPDLKYMARVTKYGNLLLLGDQGYRWQLTGDGAEGEFTGDHERDEQFELKRWRYLQRLLNEGKPDSGRPFGDQRRTELKSRYGSRLELRDVGWAQRGPVESKTRQGEYGEPRIISGEEQNDFRWVKLRTKGGWLFQAYDKGFHPQEDRFVRRKLIDECGHLSEREDKHWAGKDARWLRIVGRHGFKFVIDERGTDEREADKRELPRGNGVLLKGRRSPAANQKPKKGNSRGFYFEFNENDALNHLTMGSPLGQVLELNDRYEYTLLAGTVGKGYATKWRGLKENEFLLEPARARDPELKSHHLLIDQENEYIRLKTRSGRGTKPDHVVNPAGVRGDLNQGVEFHDGSLGDGPWVELVDSEHRGLWFSQARSLGVWRGRRGSRLFQWFLDREGEQHIVLFNDGGPQSRIHVYCSGDVDVKGRRVHVEAEQALHLKAGTRMYLEAEDALHLRSEVVNLEGSGARLTLQGQVKYDPDLIKGANGAERADGAATPTPPAKVEPGDRAQTYNGPFEDCPRDEVEHPVGGPEP